ncbi:unnamed protein product [Paramecium octaurelia]|uniref:PSI domain-containing protein n=1 Tax=Paramecium octaurelia TaxID=43137 RepID=A0A8S1V6I9_PAROT|nr:unnamed protein product [Paramecium octaurelia]
MIILILIQVVNSQVCNCGQLKSQSDCKLNTICQWNNNSCKEKQNQTIGTYCKQFDQSKCSTITGCMFYDSQCQQLTGCTSFEYNTDELCKSVSSSCISNGEVCIDMGECISYVQKSTCKLDLRSQLCFWDGQACSLADACSKLPYTTDEACRKAKSTCTVNFAEKACMDGGNCKDMQKQSQCFWNKSQTIKCKWISGKCQDYTCMNAPTTMTTDAECESYLSGCTTQAGGGCTFRTTCVKASNQNACVSDANGAKCTWMDTYCSDRYCSQGSKSFITNPQCDSFLKGCIAKPQGGCVQNKECDAALSQETCQYDIHGNQCVWNKSICQLKICKNAPIIENIDHNYCEQFLSSCTMVAGQCATKTCENASLSIINCRQFLSGCVSKLNGGCQRLTTCAEIINQDDCIKDSKNQFCLWFNDKCIDQQCSVIQKSADQECSSILQNCINDKSGNCLDYQCSNIWNQDQCTIDFYQSNCTWKPVCYLKTCYNASKTFNTHQLCNNFLSSCTVNKDKKGCMEITNNCEAYKIQESCIKKLDNSQCEWYNNQCLSKSCETADKIKYVSMKLCNEYLSGCVVSPSLKGCMTLPEKCQPRLIADVCLFDNSCYWYQDECIEKSKTCDNTPKPFCNSGCVWANEKCVQNLCNVIPNQSHQMCNAINNTCTVNEKRSGCITLLQKCSDYKTNYQCYLSKTQKCFWNGAECLEFQCIDIPDDATHFDTFEKCQQEFTTCTVIPVLNQTGCLNRLSKCELYTLNQCTYTLEGKECIWLDGLCQQLDKVNCSSIVDYSNCDTTLFQCKQSGEICVNKLCSEIQVEDFSLTFSKCQSYSQTCSIHAGLNSCIDIQNDCNQYLIEEHCIQSKTSLCHYFNNKCVNRNSIYGCPTVKLETYTDIKCKQFKQFCKLNSTSNGCADTGCILYYGLTSLADCEAVDNTCTVNAARTGCTTKVSLCTSLDKDNCIKAQEGFCAWVSSTCQLFKDNDCSQITLFQYSHQLCNQVSIKCSANAQETQCITMTENCSLYQQSNCFQSKNSFCFYNGTTCANINTITSCSDIKVTSKAICDRYDGSQNPLAICTFVSGNSNCIPRTCQNYPDNKFSHQNCSTWLATCTQNIAKTSCITMEKTCDLYVEGTCYKSQNSYCQFNSTCLNVTSTCSQIAVDERCTQNSLCMINNTSKCVDKTCENYQNSAGYTHNVCSSFLTTCTVLKDLTQCMTLLEDCTKNLIQNQCTKSLQGDCIWLQNKCVAATCDTVTDCESYNCIVKKQAGCTNLLENCSLYATQIQCKKSLNKICYWNGSKCTDLTCENLKGVGFNSVSDCNSILDSCTIDGSKIQQCMTKKECSLYQYEIECSKDVLNKECYWKNNACNLKSCNVLVLSQYSHVNCMDQIINNKQNICTINDNGTGCIELKQCSSYKSEKNCIIGIAGELCGWKNEICNVKSCDTAPINVSTHEDCYKYFNGCTINATNDGCIKIPDQCSQMNESQCKTDNCTWQDSKCQDKTCSNAPQNLISESQCNAYLKNCGFVNNQKCFQFQCEDVEFKSHQECYDNYKCTSNGFRCTAIQEQCYYYTTPISCVIDVTKSPCTWVEKSLECQIRRCDNAPQSLITNDSCNFYYPNCTTKAGGGCQELQELCTSYTVQEGCLKTVNKTQCVWDSNQCRDKSCIDLFGSSHPQCNGQDSNCTIGLQGKCAVQNNCSTKVNQETCIVGTDGPCLWIIKNNSGQCYQYNDCTSLKWKTDQECKLISPLCTTNGDNCIAIQKCSSNKISGCYTGIDGPCILTIDSNNIKSCQLFKNCTQAKFTTHEECQIANINCTTNTIDSCIALNDNCSSYKLVGQCKQNSKGTQYTEDNNINSTGICIWESGQCRDQSCQDLKGNNHDECSKQLVSCTYNSIGCISIAKCSQYQDQNTCLSAVASDGLCFWDKNICRIKLCLDIQEPKSQIDCQSNMNSCIYDEVNKICVQKSNCSSYKSESLCNQGSITGSCVWQSTKCVDYIQCNMANSSETVCTSNSFCNWVTKLSNQQNSTNTTTQQCESYTCATWYNTKQKCEPFLSFDKSTYNYCSMNNNTCVSISVSQFDQTNCYLFSKYTYTWDQTLQNCVICQKVINNTNNNTNNTNQTIDQKAFILNIYIFMIFYTFY